MGEYCSAGHHNHHTTTSAAVFMTFLKWKKPRVVLAFCLLFSIIFGIISSLFIYYPSGFGMVEEPSPLISDFHENSISLTLETEKHRPNHKTHGVAAVANHMGFHNHKENGIFLEPSRAENKMDGLQGLSHVETKAPFVHKAEATNFSRVIDNRLVHLDLKGSPPKLEYVKNILRLAKQAGITGVLLEWEDTFPWNGQLENLTLSHGAYTVEQARELVEFCEERLGLDIIPLVQTFGHVEFILKSAEFRHLRELDEDPQSFCPSKVGTMDLIMELIDQVLDFHKNSKFVHIGCDEVFNLRMCSLCTSHSDSRDDLFLSHVTKVASYVRSKGRIPIIWDDMLRNIPIQKLNESDIGNIVEPMVWVYAEEVDRFVGWDSWDKYSLIFPTVWAAAAYKGAFGESLTIPPVSRHADNVAKWIEVITRESPKWSMGVGGLVLTGWQRYDHFAILCELLPAAVPSLVYTALILSTPSGLGSPAIKNRVFINDNTTKPLSSTMLTNVLKSTANPSHTPVASVVVGTRLSKRTARIPHPRILMNREPESKLSRFGPNNNFRSPVQMVSKWDIISREFFQILSCPPTHHGNTGTFKLSMLLKESDSDLSYATRCNFPGVAFFRSLFRLRNVNSEVYQLEEKVERKRGWMTPYNARHNYSLPFRVNEVVLTESPRLKQSLRLTAKSVVTSLANIFDQWVITEWIEQNVWEPWRILDRLEKEAFKLKGMKVWPRRPVQSPKEMLSDLDIKGLITTEQPDEL